jgi:uncharacterized protein YqeY
MSLRARVQEDMKTAMKARDTQRLSAIRLLLAAVKQREVDERRELSDAEVTGVIDKMIKQRRDSIEQYRKAARDDLADAESYELNLLSAYLPKPLSEGEVAAEIEAAMVESKARAMADMGKVMALLKPRLAGKADLAKVSALVRVKLGP